MSHIHSYLPTKRLKLRLEKPKKYSLQTYFDSCFVTDSNVLFKHEQTNFWIYERNINY